MAKWLFQCRNNSKNKLEVRCEMAVPLYVQITGKGGIGLQIHQPSVGTSIPEIS
jgi:hypothetical protein